jgi:hypothetical protein
VCVGNELPNLFGGKEFIYVGESSMIHSLSLTLDLLLYISGEVRVVEAHGLTAVRADCHRPLSLHAPTDQSEDQIAPVSMLGPC